MDGFEFWKTRSIARLKVSIYVFKIDIILFKPLGHYLGTEITSVQIFELLIKFVFV